MKTKIFDALKIIFIFFAIYFFVIGILCAFSKQTFVELFNLNDGIRLQIQDSFLDFQGWKFDVFLSAVLFVSSLFGWIFFKKIESKSKTNKE